MTKRTFRTAGASGNATSYSLQCLEFQRLVSPVQSDTSGNWPIWARCDSPGEGMDESLKGIAGAGAGGFRDFEQRLGGILAGRRSAGEAGGRGERRDGPAHSAAGAAA